MMNDRIDHSSFKYPSERLVQQEPSRTNSEIVSEGHADQINNDSSNRTNNDDTRRPEDFTSSISHELPLPPSSSSQTETVDQVNQVNNSSFQNSSMRPIQDSQSNQEKIYSSNNQHSLPQSSQKVIFVMKGPISQNSHSSDVSVKPPPPPPFPNILSRYSQDFEAKKEMPSFMKLNLQTNFHLIDKVTFYLIDKVTAFPIKQTNVSLNELTDFAANEPIIFHLIDRIILHLKQDSFYLDKQDEQISSYLNKQASLDRNYKLIVNLKSQASPLRNQQAIFDLINKIIFHLDEQASIWQIYQIFFHLKSQASLHLNKQASLHLNDKLVFYLKSKASFHPDEQAIFDLIDKFMSNLKERASSHQNKQVSSHQEEKAGQYHLNIINQTKSLKQGQQQYYKSIKHQIDQIILSLYKRSPFNLNEQIILHLIDNVILHPKQQILLYLIEKVIEYIILRQDTQFLCHLIDKVIQYQNEPVDLHLIYKVFYLLIDKAFNSLYIKQYPFHLNINLNKQAIRHLLDKVIEYIILHQDNQFILYLNEEDISDLHNKVIMKLLLQSSVHYNYIFHLIDKVIQHLNETADLRLIYRVFDFVIDRIIFLQYEEVIQYLIDKVIEYIMLHQDTQVIFHLLDKVIFYLIETSIFLLNTHIILHLIDKVVLHPNKQVVFHVIDKVILHIKEQARFYHQSFFKSRMSYLTQSIMLKKYQLNGSSLKQRLKLHSIC